jgi:predicted dehydrogenase
MPIFGSRAEPYQLALVGGAHIHTPNFIKRLTARRDVRVTAIWEHDDALAARLSSVLDAPRCELDVIWANPAIGGVIICAETNRHEELVLAAAAAGKALFVEKPLGLGAGDAGRMADAIERAGGLFQTGFFMRGQPINRFLREQVVAGNFGQLTRLRVMNCHAGALNGLFDSEWRWMADPAIAGVGGFGDLGAHALDLLLWFLDGQATPERGTARLGSATGRYGDCDEYGEGLLSFSGGITASIAAGWVDPRSHVSVEIAGTGGYATVANGELFFESGTVPGADGKRAWKTLPEMLPHAFEQYLDAVTGQTDVPLVTAREAATRSAIMEALYESARHESWVALI